MLWDVCGNRSSLCFFSECVLSSSRWLWYVLPSPEAALHLPRVKQLQRVTGGLARVTAHISDFIFTHSFHMFRTGCGSVWRELFRWSSSCPAELNSHNTHLNQLMNVCGTHLTSTDRCVWSGLELNSAGHCQHKTLTTFPSVCFRVLSQPWPSQYGGAVDLKLSGHNVIPLPQLFHVCITTHQNERLFKPQTLGMCWS